MEINLKKHQPTPLQPRSDLQISLLDKIYSRLFSRYSLLMSDKTDESLAGLVAEFRTEGLFAEMEQWINRNHDNVMKRLDKACPGLTPEERKLIMLLHLGFSSTSIAFLTARPSKQSVYTAKCRLRQHLNTFNLQSIPGLLGEIK